MPVKPIDRDAGDGSDLFSFCSIADEKAEAEGYLSDWMRRNIIPIEISEFSKAEDQRTARGIVTDGGGGGGGGGARGIAETGTSRFFSETNQSPLL